MHRMLLRSRDFSAVRHGWQARGADGRARLCPAVSATGRGAQDYLVKGRLDPEALGRAFSRVGQVHDEWKPVGLDRTLDRALADLALVVEESGATVVREGPLPEVTGDATALSMVWQNLIGNAVKFRRTHRAGSRSAASGRASAGTSGCRTTASASHRSPPRRCSSSSSVCTAGTSTRERA